MSYSRIEGQAAADSIPRSNNPENSHARLLNDTFGSDSEDNEDWIDDRQGHMLEANSVPSMSAVVQSNTENDDSDSDTANETNQGTGRGLLANIMYGWRLPFNNNSQTETRTERRTVSANDGVFGNIDAEPDGRPGSLEGADDGEEATNEIPPTYEEAAADATPSYWETTIITSQYPDEVMVGEMPVGSLIHFAWNLLISTTFSYFGFFATYLFHTSHAAKGGSLTGLGLTLCQNFYSFGENGSSPTNGPNEFIPSSPNSFEGGTQFGTVRTGESVEAGAADSTDLNTMANIMLAVGILLIVKGVGDFLYAVALRSKILNYNSYLANNSNNVNNVENENENENEHEHEHEHEEASERV